VLVTTEVKEDEVTKGLFIKTIGVANSFLSGLT
jgi:hypothetical protein